MPLAVVQTNLPKANLPADLMSKFSDFIVKTLECDERVTMIEIHADVPMMRAGSTDPILNLTFHHNDDKITDDSKRDYAAKFAEFVIGQIPVLPIDRILVLFFDTRLTTCGAIETRF